MNDDERDLAGLGYTQQLLREMGGFGNFAVSFSIISILTGAVLLYGYGLKFAGPAVNSIGWPIVSMLTLCVAASMAEIASAYPTAGGLYFWARKMGGKRWGWVTAWLNMIGQVAITAGINVAAAIYLIGAFTHTSKSWAVQIGVMVLIMIPQVVINLWGVRLTARLNDLSVWWHIGGVLLIVVALTFFGRHHNSLSFLFSYHPTTNLLESSKLMSIGDRAVHSPLFRLFPKLAALYAAAPMLLLFVLSLLQAQWTYTGYDASAHMAEETKMARMNSAWGIVLSVGVSAIAGYLMLMVLTWCIPHGDVAATANDPYPVLYIISNNVAPFLSKVIAIVIGVAMWLCGVASVTSMGRMWYAFARDDGMPGSRWLKRVSGKHQTPHVAIIVTSVLSVLICLYASAWYVVTSISTICLYLAYGIPIWLKLRRGLEADAPWSLGRWSPIVNVIALIWIAVITIVFMLPPNELVLWTMLAVFVLMAASRIGEPATNNRPTILPAGDA